MSSDRFDTTPEEEAEIDKELVEIETTITESVPEGWVHVAVAVPESFAEIFYDTLASYMALRETDKEFPGLEAMVMEARNSLSTIN